MTNHDALGDLFATDFIIGPYMGGIHGDVVLIFDVWNDWWNIYPMNKDILVRRLYANVSGFSDYYISCFFEETPLLRLPDALSCRMQLVSRHYGFL